jgi:hypothetical protein
MIHMGKRTLMQIQKQSTFWSSNVIRIAMIKVKKIANKRSSIKNPSKKIQVRFRKSLQSIDSAALLNIKFLTLKNVHYSI